MIQKPRDFSARRIKIVAGKTLMLVKLSLISSREAENENEVERDRKRDSFRW